uniref:Putative secreted protein n=1 Tax=Anopheles darlingi TaxID=43151 RepID=A0A2M4DDX1_ANODA
MVVMDVATVVAVVVVARSSIVWGRGAGPATSPATAEVVVEVDIVLPPAVDEDDEEEEDAVDDWVADEGEPELSR